MMRRGIALLVGVAGLVALVWMAAHAPLPIGGVAPRIQTALQAAAEEALNAHGLEWARVEMSGQVAVLSGAAPREEERSIAREAVLNVLGGGGFWAGRVTRVRDAMTVAPPLSPYVWSAEREGGRLLLSGAAPSPAMRQELAAYAEALFADEADNQMIVARGAPDERAWMVSARTAVAQLASLDAGRAVLTDERLRLEGAAPDRATRARVVSAVAKLPRPFLAVARIEAPEAHVEAEAVRAAQANIVPVVLNASPQACQEAIDTTMVDGAIIFASGRSVINKESYTVMDRLAAAAAALRCRGAQIRVEGHTDSSGDPAANERLSKNRAQAVVDYLILRGVPTERLAAEGYGDVRPIADNDTEEGRAQNRRIEIHVQH